MSELVKELRGLREDVRAQTQVFVEVALAQGWQPSDDLLSVAVDELIEGALGTRNPEQHPAP